MPAIFADSYGGLQQGIASDRASRENDLRQALQMVVQRNQEMQRRRELRDAIAMQQQQQDIANEMARRTFDEQVREFNVGNQTRIGEANLRRQANTEKTDVIPSSVQAYQKKIGYELALQGLYNGDDQDLLALNAQSNHENNQAAQIGEQIAGVDRRRQLLNKSLKQSQQTVKDIPWWRKAWSAMVPLYQDPTYTEEEQRQANINAQLENMPPQLRQQEMDTYTQPNPMTGFRKPIYNYRTNGVPVNVAPRGFQPPRRMLNFNPGGMPTGTNAMPVGPVIDAPSIVQTNQTQIATQPSKAQTLNSIAARIHSQNPDWTVEQVRQAVLRMRVAQ